MVKKNDNNQRDRDFEQVNCVGNIYFYLIKKFPIIFLFFIFDKIR